MTSEYGMYRLSFTPPADSCPHYPSISIEMTTPGDASVDNMLRFFEAFLAASGYVLKGELQVVEPEPEPKEEFVPFNLYNFGDYHIGGSAGTDTISFGAAQPVMEFGAKTWDDVISFG